LVPNDFVSRASQQSTIPYGYLSSDDIEKLSRIHLNHHEDPDTVVDIKGYLDELYLTEGERGRLHDLVGKAPNIDEFYRILNRFGQRSLSNRDEVKKSLFVFCLGILI
jgi:hypothetical protein